MYLKFRVDPCKMPVGTPLALSVPPVLAHWALCIAVKSDSFVSDKKITA
jgi:hypothetical protein